MMISNVKVKPVSIPSLTDGAAQTLPLLPPFGVTQNVNNERGELPGVEPGQLLTSLRGQNVYSLGMNYMDIVSNIITFYFGYFCIIMNNTSSLFCSLPSVKSSFFLKCQENTISEEWRGQ